MPLYAYSCHSCGRQVDEVRSVAERHNGPVCCESQMSLTIVPPQVQPVLGGGKFPGYHCPVTDQFITSRKQRAEIMKRHNLIEKG